MIRKLVIISILWGLLIMILSSIPGNSLPKSPSIPHFDKLVHAGLYFILASFILPVLDLSKHNIVSKLSIPIVLSIVIIYGGFIEIAQDRWFTVRSGDTFDFLADIAGGVLAIGFYFIFSKKFFKKKF